MTLEVEYKIPIKKKFDRRLKLGSLVGVLILDNGEVRVRPISESERTEKFLEIFHPLHFFAKTTGKTCGLDGESLERTEPDEREESTLACRTDPSDRR